MAHDSINPINPSKGTVPAEQAIPASIGGGGNPRYVITYPPSNPGTKTIRAIFDDINKTYESTQELNANGQPTIISKWIEV